MRHKRFYVSRSAVRAFTAALFLTFVAATLATIKYERGRTLVNLFGSALVEATHQGSTPKLTAAQSPAGSNLFQQTGYLTAGDLTPDDNMGNAVGISGNTAIVGAMFHTVNAQHLLGAAYIFLRAPNNTWSLQQEIPNPGSNLNFGFSVAISGDTAVVGSPSQGTSDQQQGPGKVYIYVRNGNVWTVQQVLNSGVEAPGASKFFGQTVAISGDTLCGGDPFSGIYVFTRTGTTWSLQQKLTANGVQGAFPAALAIDRGTLIGSAPGPQGAYVFVRSGAGWSQQQVLTPSDGSPGDSFGNAVAVSGDSAVIGSHLADINGHVDQGAAYVFDRAGSTWTQRQKLVASDGQADRQFGDSVCISNSMIVVGAGKDRVNGPDDPKGAAYVFTRDLSNQWNERQKLTGNSDTLRFGQASAIDGASLVIGAPFDRNGTTPPTLPPGAAYAFQMPDTDGDGLPDDWEQNGVSINGLFIDLPAMGANPLHKDIFIHADWMQPDPSRPGSVIKPNPRAIKIVTDAFLRAPVDNPDHKQGINLHVDLGPDSVMNPVTGAKWGVLSRAGAVPFQSNTGTFSGGIYNWSALDAIKTIYFGPAERSPVFHYALFANRYGMTSSSGISRGIRAADFLVTLGSFSQPGGTVMQQAGTFMHEFGHNLGLHHGGNDDINYKPNYVSIMNYSFQFPGLLTPSGKRTFDYSRVALPALNETNLDENAGISDPAGHLTLWNMLTSPTSPAGSNKCVTNPNGYYRLFFPSRALDWNCDGARTSVLLQADVNGDGYCVGAGANGVIDSLVTGDDDIRRDRFGRPLVVSGPNRTCETSIGGDDVQIHSVGFVEPNPLTGFNDWPALVFDGNGVIGSGDVNLPQVQTTVDIEPSQDDLLRDVPPALLDAEQTAPVDVVTLSPESGPAPLVVTFDGSASQATNGTIVNWSWNFGDGVTGSGAMVTHTYSVPGDYYATLDVTDSNGGVNLVPLLYHVAVTDPSATPTPTPTSTPTPVPTPTPIPSSTPTPTPGPGDVDSVFEASVSQNTMSVKAVLIQPDGKVLIGGGFESFGGAPMRAVARVNPDGSPDSTFRPGLSVPFERALSYPVSLALQPDGKILVGIHSEATSSLPNDSPVLVRLNPNGSLDQTFHTNLSRQGTTSEVRAIDLAPDGKIVVAGAFISGLRRNITRLEPDGTFDQSFFMASGIPLPQPVSSLALQPDGKIIIAGSFSNSTTGGALPRVAVARLNSDGSLDSTFDAHLLGLGDGVATVTHADCISLQPDGKILAGGLFDFDGTNQHNEIIARFNPDGTRDQSFTDVFPTIVGGGQEVETMALQPNGKVIIGGIFSTAAGSNQFARLNADGTLDNSFNLGNNFTTQGVFGAASVNSIALRTSGPQAGKVVVGGEFIIFSGSPVEGIIQLNADASLDMGFASNGPGFNARVLALAQQADGKLLVGFTPPISGINFTRLNQAQRQGIGRLNADGTTDPTFTSPFVRNANTNAVRAMAVQADGKILVSGSLQLPGADFTSTLARLNADGSIDSGFVPYSSAGGGPVAVQPDGKIITNGFTSGSGLVRLNPNGSLDQSFKVILGRDGQANAIAIQPDGRILIGGNFTAVCDNLTCVPRNNIGRINQDGSPDASFDPGTGADNVVLALVLQPDGKALIGGSFLNVNGTARAAIARLNTNGNLDTSFVPVNPNTDQFGFSAPVLSLALQLDEKVLFGSRYVSVPGAPPDRVQRLNTDGTVDPDFNHGAGANGDVNALVIRPDGLIVVGGNFSAVNNTACLALCGLLSTTSGPTPTPTPTPSPSPSPTPSPSPGTSLVQFSSSTLNVQEDCTILTIMVNRVGDTSGSATVDYSSADVTASERSDYIKAIGTLYFGPGEVSKSFGVLINEDSYVEGNEVFNLTLSNPVNVALGSPSITAVTIIDDPTEPSTNPLDDPRLYVGQHYHDFLNRQPDQSGWDFWTNQISACGVDLGCAEVYRINVSAAFFLSIEFQQTGYLVERVYKTAYGDASGTSTFNGTHQLAIPVVRFNEFLSDMGRIGQGVVVLAPGWEQLLESNKQAYAREFVQTARFTTALPTTMTPTEFVDKLNQNAGNVLSASERTTAINLFAGAHDTSDVTARAQALRQVAEDPDLVNGEFNRAFVLMQYFGYLRRNPNDVQDTDYTGYDFWLTKLNQFNGNYVNAEMVKAFLSSGEYRQRFGP